MMPRRDAGVIYTYCITEGEPIAAADGLHPSRSVYSLVCEDLVAVVSRVPEEEFGDESLPAHLADACWLESEARAHEQVIEKVMESRTVLPMRLCTIFRTGAKVRELLRTRQHEFRRALARLRGKEEWEVRLYLAPSGTGSQPAATIASSGKEYLLRKRDETLRGEEESCRIAREAQESFEALAGCVAEVQLKPLPAQSLPGDLQLVWDAVCLVPKPDFHALRQRVEGLGNQLAGNGWRFQVTGPWPPYHFAAEAHEHVSLP